MTSALPAETLADHLRVPPAPPPRVPVPLSRPDDLMWFAGFCGLCAAAGVVLTSAVLVWLAKRGRLSRASGEQSARGLIYGTFAAAMSLASLVGSVILGDPYDRPVWSLVLAGLFTFLTAVGLTAVAVLPFAKNNSRQSVDSGSADS